MTTARFPGTRRRERSYPIPDGIHPDVEVLPDLAPRRLVIGAEDVHGEVGVRRTADIPEIPFLQAGIDLDRGARGGLNGFRGHARPSLIAAQDSRHL